jgi:integrase
VGKYQHQ